MCDGCGCFKCGWIGLPTEKYWEQSDNWSYESPSLSIGSPLPARIARMPNSQSGWAGRMMSIERFDKIDERSGEYEQANWGQVGALSPSIRINRMGGKVAKAILIDFEGLANSSTERIGIWIGDGLAVWIDPVAREVRRGTCGPRGDEIETDDSQLIYSFTDPVGSVRLAIRVYHDSDGGQHLWIYGPREQAAIPATPVRGFLQQGYQFRYVGPVEIGDHNRLAGVFIHGGGEIHGAWGGAVGTGVTAGCGTPPYLGNCIDPLPILSGDAVTTAGGTIAFELQSAGWDALWAHSLTFDPDNRAALDEKTWTINAPASGDLPTEPSGVTYPTTGTVECRAGLTGWIAPMPRPVAQASERAYPGVGQLATWEYNAATDGYLFGPGTWPAYNPATHAIPDSSISSASSAVAWAALFRSGFTGPPPDGEILWGVRLRLSIVVRLTNPGKDHQGVRWMGMPNFSDPANYMVRPQVSLSYPTPTHVLTQECDYRAHWTGEGQLTLSRRGDPGQLTSSALSSAIAANGNLDVGWALFTYPSSGSDRAVYRFPVSDLGIQWPTSITLNEPT